MAAQGKHPLLGMRDLFEEENRRKLRVQNELQAALSLCGYRTVDTPVLEPTDIFLRKSGGELASQMYSFVEPGGHQVSLRPEFTSQVIRLFLQQNGSLPLPVRWQYAGPVFRYTAGDTGQGRQYTQVGAELIGAGGPAAEAEVMATACGALTSLGLRPLRLVVGDVGAVLGLLRQFSLSERATHYLLNVIGQLRDGEDQLDAVRARAEELGLFVQGERQGMAALGQHLAAVDATEASTFGARSATEILERLARKLQASDDPGQLERAMQFTGALARLNGAPQDTVERARSLAASYSLDPAPLDTLDACVAALSLHDAKDVEVSVDLGLAGGLAYYTGPLFEVWGGLASVRPEGNRRMNGVRLGSGGRYDGLVKALGGSDDVPALGFAYSLENVLDELTGADLLAEDSRGGKRALVAPRTSAAVAAALRTAASLRLGGEAAAVALNGEVDEDSARRQGFVAIVAVDEDGASERTWL